ncbi:MAG: rhomboid family intramembrane serine protease [Oscillospiraceae bacterium]|nr:rhomboid family intramembrane serine protease [Oscillospiraceae bacterium]
MRRQNITITNNAPAVLGFALACLAALLLDLFTGGNANKMLFMTYHSSLKNVLTYVRFFTHVLGHSSWAHFIGNMSYILLLGPTLEEKYGPAKIFEVIGITALVTGLVNWFFFPSVALCGASGVVFAFILMISFTNVRSGEIPITVILVALIFLGEQIYEGIFLRDNVSNLSHVLGGLVGAVVGYHLNIRR